MLLKLFFDYGITPIIQWVALAQELWKDASPIL